MNTFNKFNKKKYFFFPDSFFSYDTIIKFGFFEQNINLRLISDWNFDDSSEERVSLSISGSKTSSSRGRLGSFKLFLIIKKR